MGVDSGIFATTRQVGGVIGSAAIGVLLRARLAVELPAQPGRPPSPSRPPIGTASSPAPPGQPSAARTSPLPGFCCRRRPRQEITRQIQALGDHTFDAAFAAAMKVTLIMPIVVLTVGVLACLAMRRPTTGDVAAAVPDAADESGSAPVGTTCRCQLAPRQPDH